MYFTGKVNYPADSLTSIAKSPANSIDLVGQVPPLIKEIFCPKTVPVGIAKS